MPSQAQYVPQKISMNEMHIITWIRKSTIAYNKGQYVGPITARMPMIICEIAGTRWQIDASILSDGNWIVDDMANKVENLPPFWI
jgi:hypothetical protein